MKGLDWLKNLIQSKQDVCYICGNIIGDGEAFLDYPEGKTHIGICGVKHMKKVNKEK